MATIIGFLGPPATAISIGVQSIGGIAVTPPNFSSGIANFLDSSLTINLPNVNIVQSKTGFIVPGFFEEFYNRFHVTPLELPVGNITKDEQRQVTVWNAFFINKNQDNIIGTNLGGITLSGGPTVKTYGGLEFLVYNVDIVLGVGPPIIDGTLTFDFESPLASQTVSITGLRAVSFPYLFQPGLQETLSWNTQVMTSNNGYEQRTKLRTSPRQSFTGSISIPNGELAALDNLLYGWRVNIFALPISSECRKPTSATDGTTAIINVSTEFGDFRVGGLAVIYKSPRNFELFTIASLTTTQLQSTTIIVGIFDTTSLVMPVMTARLVTSPTRSTDGHRQRLDFNFLVTQNATLATTASPTQYKGLDVYLDEPLTIDQFATDLYTNRVDVADFQTGLVDTFAPWLKTKIQRQFGKQFDNLSDVWTYRLWLHRREGKLRPFWMPTFEANMKLLTTGALGTQFIIQNDGQDSLSAERDDIAFLTTTGWILRGVSSIIISGIDLQVTVDLSIGVEASTVILISWLGRKRLTSDSLEINWAGNNTAEATVPITEINN